MTFGFIENSMYTGTHGTKQEIFPRGYFHNKFLIDFKLETRKYAISSSFPSSELDLNSVAEKLGSSLDVVSTLFKLLIQEIGRFARDEVASGRCIALKLECRGLGTLICKNRAIYFEMHQSIKDGFSRQFIEIDRIGPQKYSGQREYLEYNKTKTSRTSINPHSISTIRPEDPLRDSPRSSQVSPRRLSSRGIYSGLDLEPLPKNVQNRPSTSYGTRRKKSSDNSDLPPLNPELEAFFNRNKSRKQ